MDSLGLSCACSADIALAPLRGAESPIAVFCLLMALHENVFLAHRCLFFMPDLARPAAWIRLRSLPRLRRAGTQRCIYYLQQSLSSALILLALDTAAGLTSPFSAPAAVGAHPCTSALQTRTSCFICCSLLRRQATTSRSACAATASTALPSLACRARSA